MQPAPPLLVALVLACLDAGLAHAQELEPRLYANVPIGLNFLVAGYAGSSGNVLVDPSIQLENARLDVDGAVLGYARSLPMGGMLGKVDAAIGRVCLSGAAEYRGERVTRDVCGLTDARVRIALNFVGAPALSIQDFRTKPQDDLVVGASLQLVAPTGRYDSDRLVNIGANRWAAKAEIGLWKLVAPWTLEVSAAATVYRANDEFLGDSRREQDPLYSLQGHVVRSFAGGVWVALDVTHYRGGRTSVDGIVNSDRQSNDRIGLTVSVPVTPSQSLKLGLSSGLSTRTGTDFDTVALAWQYRWGQG